MEWCPASSAARTEPARWSEIGDGMQGVRVACGTGLRAEPPLANLVGNEGVSGDLHGEPPSRVAPSSLGPFDGQRQSRSSSSKQIENRLWTLVKKKKMSRRTVAGTSSPTVSRSRRRARSETVSVLAGAISVGGSCASPDRDRTGHDPVDSRLPYNSPPRSRSQLQTSTLRWKPPL